MKPGYSLRWRLLASMLVVFVLGVGATSVFYYAEAGAMGRDLQARTLRSQARELLAGLQVAGDGRVRVDLPAEWVNAYARKDSGFYYTLYDSSHRAVARSANLDHDLPFSNPPEAKAFGGLHFAGVGTDRLATVAARGPEGHVLLVARGHVPEETLVWSLLEENLEYIGVVLLPFIAVALALMWLISGWSLRPVARASREAAAVGPKNLAARISTTNLPNEIRVLVDAVNGALDRLAAAYAAERRLTADAAHELRTPLAVLSLRLQRAKADGAFDWPVVEREMAQMGRSVSQLLDLARKESAERTGASDGMPVNLPRIVREAAAMVLPIAETMARPVDVEAPEVLPIRGRADDLRDMVRNLLDNALAHGRGAVRATVRQEEIGNKRLAVIEVADEGPGIPLALRETVFERFRKGVAASPGAGLGLAIVRQVAHSHHGEVGFLPGSDCRIRVVLPLEPEW